MPKCPVDSYAFVLVVVEHDERVLVVQERKHGQTFYLPAGGVELGETLVDAAVRETMEEAGVVVRPTHLLAMDQRWSAAAGRPFVCFRFVLSAEVLGDPTPKRDADRHSLGARWVTADEARRLPLRSTEVVDFVELARARGATPGLSLGLVTQSRLADTPWSRMLAD